MMDEVNKIEVGKDEQLFCEVENKVMKFQGYTSLNNRGYENPNEKNKLCSVSTAATSLQSKPLDQEASKDREDKSLNSKLDSDDVECQTESTDNPIAYEGVNKITSDTLADENKSLLTPLDNSSEANTRDDVPKEMVDNLQVEVKVEPADSGVYGHLLNGDYRLVAISDTDSSSDTDDDTSSESESVQTINVESDIREEIVISDHNSDEESGGQKKREKSTGEVLRTKGELLPEELPPLNDLKITVDPNVELVHIGSVSSIVGVLAVIQSNKNIPPLDDDTILFLEGRTVLGQIFEVFGPVGLPWYSVRFNSIEDIKTRQISVGTKVYCAPKVGQYTKYVFVEHLKMMRGSDASWEDNNEPPSQYLDYSDDEQERSAKAKNRKKNKKVDQEDGSVLPGARIPKQRKHKERKPKNRVLEENTAQEECIGNQTHRESMWHSRHQNGYNSNDRELSNNKEGHIYQTFQPFGPSPRFRPRVSMNRPPPRHQGPIRPSNFQPNHRTGFPRPWQGNRNEHPGNLFPNNNPMFRPNSTDTYPSNNFVNNDINYQRNSSLWGSNPCFGQHSFPGCMPDQRVANQYRFDNMSQPPHNHRLMDNRLIQNQMDTTNLQQYPPDFSLPPPSFQSPNQMNYNN